MEYHLADEAFERRLAPSKPKSDSTRLFPRTILEPFPFTDEELDAAGLRGEGERFRVRRTDSGDDDGAPGTLKRTRHPDLLYRSDLLENPFPIPKGRHPHLPTKTAHGVFNTPLNTVWDTVAPQIRQLLKTLEIRYSAIKTARFVTHGEDGKDTVGPVVIWISTHPTTTTAENAHDASLDILALLKGNGVEGVVVEWYEGAVAKL